MVASMSVFLNEKKWRTSTHFS
uniref:Uncharacterized protein n=1 Tax=Rhizophora mucronata TaxID=61149 RepID=A0A2P2PD62_RHIMU